MTEQTKTWAMYDGPNCPSYITRGKWYEVVVVYPNDCPIGHVLLGDDGSGLALKWDGCSIIGGDNWQRHDGPTPPDDKELANLGQAFDDDRWIAHDAMIAERGAK